MNRAKELGRLRVFINDHFDGSSKEFARSVGMDPSTLCNILKGRRKVSRKALVKIVRGTDGQIRDVDLYPELAGVGTE